MLITPRTYSASQTLDRFSNRSGPSYRLRFSSSVGWHADLTDADRVTEMLLTRQTGSVRVGEVIRYTLTYRPAADEIQPPPAALHVQIRNTSAIPLRAAYLHGPYTLYASCYPYSFEPNIPTNCVLADNDIPQFEPYLKAGGTWNAVIPIPRPNWKKNPISPECPTQQEITWVIEIVSQVIFSSTASVNFEVLVGRDETSLDSLLSGTRAAHSKAANLRDHWPSGSKGKQLIATKGVFSDSISLLIDDTASLWNTPHLPTSHYDQETDNIDSMINRSPVEISGAAPESQQSESNETPPKSRKKIHLVVLTHGLHSNLGADWLFMKEAIDAACRKTRSQQESRVSADRSTLGDPSSCNVDEGHGFQNQHVIVRGFPGNAARTERGIQYLGKRLAKYVLLMTYPDQPYLPHKRSKIKTYSNSFAPWKGSEVSDTKAQSSRIDGEELDVDEHHAYQITSISFIGHSLGGLVQTYAIAYIQKHSPEFFDRIAPINFIALATPFLGLSNENPLYVRFALDLGLVGRTGQDLGLSWTSPRVRTGWGSIIGGKGQFTKSQGEADARAKPLLRILPSGPAHEVLVKFKRRTIYSNLINDGIVPLRTSCLFFLDWKEIQRVEKARRENGIVGTMAEWGWAELTGANSRPRYSRRANDLQATSASRSAMEAMEETSITMASPRSATTQPSSSPASSLPPRGETAIRTQPPSKLEDAFTNTEMAELPPQPPSSPLNNLFSMFKPKDHGHKQAKVFKRSQTATPIPTDLIHQNGSYHDHTSHDVGINAPPKTTVFESAGDILMPPLPPIDYIVNPASRPRTILHDRIYHPEDIPPPMAKRLTPTGDRSQDGTTVMHHAFADDPPNETGLKVEEKIARAYHRGVSWRKVLVRLEPDAHNNIIVRRMFANAYGWPVVEHLVDTHFGPGSLSNAEDIRNDNSGSSARAVEAPVHARLASPISNGSNT
ncbi:putative serine esterase-domain-containing protein [Aspergillus aurantiobrunneus]